MSPTVEVLVGVVGRAHGVRGEVSIEVRTDEPGRRFAPGTVLRIEDTDRTLTVADSRDHSGRLLVRFAGLDDRTGVESVRGARLVTDVDEAELPEEPDEYYDRQLLGLRVVGPAGEDVGPVRGVLHLPLQDVLEVETSGGLRLVPFVEAIVPEVDLAAGTIRVADLVGLLSDSEGDDGEDAADGSS